MFLNPVWKYPHWTLQWTVLVACKLLSHFFLRPRGPSLIPSWSWASQLRGGEHGKSGRGQRNTARSQATGSQPPKGRCGLHCCPLFLLTLKCWQQRGTLEPGMQVRRRGGQGLPLALPLTKNCQEIHFSLVTDVHPALPSAWLPDCCVCICTTISFHVGSSPISWILWIYWGFLLTLVFKFLPSLIYNSYFCCFNLMVFKLKLKYNRYLYHPVQYKGLWMMGVCNIFYPAF